ncbi:MAG: T9SS type A sorting domain-containing protein [Bacteroidetes bacterium]|nr:T9SS type A sorting domain-containing protein [Bacteroidota bacterium]MBL7103108.1 T9SS type A sorting domain-containing protein [Bacteroidales bacterium]
MKLIRYFITFIILLPFFAHTQDTIRYPVDIVYHEQSEQYYVSNWADNTAGNILKLNSEGQITGTFYDELNYVGGLCLINDILYITNNMDLYGGSQPSYLVGININTGVSILNFEISTGGTYLDLMTTDNNGNLYIGDSEKMKIYKYNLQTGLVTDFVTNITNPFGVFYDYISDRILFTNSSFTNSYIKSKSPQGGEITTVFYHNGYLEGITMDDEGNFYLSSWGNDYQWGNEPVYKTNHDFSWKYEISNNHNRPFGMCIGKDTCLVVCNWGEHTLSFIETSGFESPFKQPFDIVFDNNNFRYFITNSCISDNSVTGNIITIKSPGDTVHTYFNDLNHPTGLCIFDQLLFVLNNTGIPNDSSSSFLTAIDINTNEIVMETEIDTSESFLEFLTHDNNNLYITDYIKNNILKFDIITQSSSEFITNVENPTGIYYKDNTDELIFISYSTTEMESYIIASDINGNITDTLFTAIYELKDIIYTESGNYYVSNSEESLVYKFDSIFSDYTIITINYDSPNGLYYNELTDDLGITFTEGNNLSFIDFSNTGIDVLIDLKNDFVIYPNPCNGRFTISAENLDRQKVKMILCDISGKLVYDYEFKINGNSFIRTFNFENLPKGTYVMVLFNDKFVEREKLIIY